MEIELKYTIGNRDKADRIWNDPYLKKLEEADSRHQGHFNGCVLTPLRASPAFRTSPRSADSSSRIVPRGAIKACRHDRPSSLPSLTAPSSRDNASRIRARA